MVVNQARKLEQLRETARAQSLNKDFVGASKTIDEMIASGGFFFMFLLFFFYLILR